MAEHLRDYEVSVWTLQDSYLTTLKWSGIDHKGQIQEPKMKIVDDGTQEFTFNIPMYLWEKDGLTQIRKENPIWYTTREGIIVKDMRKIKVIFNKTFGTEEQKKANQEKVYEFLIVKVEDQHSDDNCICQISCEGLAFHELGHQGYKRELSSELFYDRNNKYCEGKMWYDSFNYGHLEQPIANIDYWLNDLGIRNKAYVRLYDSQGVYTSLRPRTAAEINSTEWYYEVRMNTAEYSLAAKGSKRDPKVIYEDEYIKSWNNDLMPTNVSEVKEKERMVDGTESNYYNLTQTIAETFGVFCKYEYSYDENYHITGRTIVFYNTFLRDYEGDSFGELTYPNTAVDITREYDSTDLTTKMFVRPETDESIYTGQVSIIDSEANPTKEDYLLNFDYLHRIGTISDEQYKEIGKFERKMRLFNCGSEDRVKAAENRGKGGIVEVDGDTGVITIRGLTGSIAKNQTVIVDGVEYLYTNKRWYYLTSLNTCQGIIDLQQQLVNKSAEKVSIDAKCAMIEKELTEAKERQSDAQKRISTLGIQSVTKNNPSIRQTSVESTKTVTKGSKTTTETRYSVELGSNHKGIIEDTIRIYLEYDTTKYEFNDTTGLKGVPESHSKKINWESGKGLTAIKNYVKWYNKDKKPNTITEASVKTKFEEWLAAINNGSQTVNKIPNLVTASGKSFHITDTYDVFEDAVAWIAYASGQASIGIMDENCFKKRVCKNIKFNNKTYKLALQGEMKGTASNPEWVSPKPTDKAGKITRISWNQAIAARKAWCGQFVDGLQASYITIKNDNTGDIEIDVKWAKEHSEDISASISNQGVVTWTYGSHSGHSLAELYNAYKNDPNQDTESYGQFYKDNFGVDWSVNHVKSFSVQKDANGNINKITHLVLDKSDVSTVYVLYDFDPRTYYQQIADMWQRKIDIKTLEQKEYKNKKAKNTMEIKALEVAVRLKLQAKFNEIQKFDHLMGPALRESYWQPENYQNYGDIYSQEINVDFWASPLTRDNKDISAKFFWDDTLFPDEDKNYYEMGVNLDRHYYPCINLKAFLADHPEHVDNFFANLKNLSFSFYNDGIDKAYKNDKGEYVIKYPVHVNTEGGWEYQLEALSDVGGTSETMTYTRTVERSEADHVFYMNGAGMQLAFVRDNQGEVIPVLMITEMDTLPEDVIHFIYQPSDLNIVGSDGVIHPGAMPMLGCYTGSVSEEVQKMEGTATDESAEMYAVTNTTSASNLVAEALETAKSTELYTTKTVDASGGGKFYSYGIVKPEHWLEYDPTSAMFTVTMNNGDNPEGSMWGEITGGDGEIADTEGGGHHSNDSNIAGHNDEDTYGNMWGEITGGTGEIQDITTTVVKDVYTMVYPRISINSLQLKTAETRLTIGQTLLPKPQFYYLFVRGNDYLLTIKPSVLFSNIISKNKVINVVRDYFFGRGDSAQIKVITTEGITKVEEPKNKKETLVIRKNKDNTYTGTYNSNKITKGTIEAVETEYTSVIKAQDASDYIEKQRYVPTYGPFTLTYTIGNGGTYVYVDAIRVLKENSVPKVSYTFTPNVVNERITAKLYDHLGQVMMINDHELKFENVFGYISSIDLDLDQPWEDSIEIKNYKNKFEDLFSSITAEAEEMKKNGGILASFNAGNLLPITNMSLSDLIEDLVFNSQRFADMWDERFDTREQVVEELSKALTEVNEVLDAGVDTIAELQDLNDSNAMLLYNMAKNIEAMATPRIYHGDPATMTNLKPGDIIIANDNKRYLAADYGDSESASIFPYFDGTVSHLTGASVDWNAETGEVSIMGSTQIDILGGGDITIAANEDIYITGNNSVNIGGATINIGSVWDDNLVGEDGQAHGGIVPGGVNIISSEINGNETATSYVKIHPDEISMLSSSIMMQGANRITLVTSTANEKIDGKNINTSGIQIDSTKGVFIGTNGGGIELYSGTNVFEYDPDNDTISYNGNSPDGTGASVSIRSSRILMGVTGSNSSGTALKITPDYLIIGSATNANTLIAANAPAFTGKATGAYIGADKISFATVNSNVRDLISLSSAGIVFAHAQVDSGSNKYYNRSSQKYDIDDIRNDNINGSYVQINSSGIRLGATANLYLNTNNIKLQTMTSSGGSGTLLAIGSNLQSITTVQQAKDDTHNYVQLFANGQELVVKGAIYASELYIGGIAAKKFVEDNAPTQDLGGWLTIGSDGAVIGAGSLSGQNFSAIGLTKTGITIKSGGSLQVTGSGSFIVDTTNFKLDSSGNLTIKGTLKSNNSSTLNLEGGAIDGSFITGSTINLSKVVGTIAHNILLDAGGTGSRGNVFEIYSVASSGSSIDSSSGPAQVNNGSVTSQTYTIGSSLLAVDKKGYFKSSVGTIGGWNYNDGGFYKKEKKGTVTMELGIAHAGYFASVYNSTAYELINSDVNPFIYAGARPTSADTPYKFNLTQGGYLRGGIYISSGNAAHTSDNGYVQILLQVDTSQNRARLRAKFYSSSKTETVDLTNWVSLAAGGN